MSLQPVNFEKLSFDQGLELVTATYRRSLVKRADLSKVLSKVLSHPAGRIAAGAGVGGALGAGSSLFQDERRRTPWSRALTGAAIGGLGTAGGEAIAHGIYGKDYAQEIASKLKNLSTMSDSGATDDVPRPPSDPSIFDPDPPMYGTDPSYPRWAWDAFRSLPRWAQAGIVGGAGGASTFKLDLPRTKLLNILSSKDSGLSEDAVQLIKNKIQRGLNATKKLQNKKGLTGPAWLQPERWTQKQRQAYRILTKGVRGGNLDPTTQITETGVHKDVPYKQPVGVYDPKTGKRSVGEILSTPSEDIVTGSGYETSSKKVPGVSQTDLDTAHIRARDAAKLTAKGSKAARRGVFGAALATLLALATGGDVNPEIAERFRAEDAS
jgi:hypothetical protein